MLWDCRLRLRPRTPGELEAIQTKITAREVGRRNTPSFTTEEEMFEDLWTKMHGAHPVSVDFSSTAQMERFRIYVAKKHSDNVRLAAPEDGIFE